jgi:hypothetical protein
MVFNSCFSISIALFCAFAIASTSVDCCTSTCTFVDNYTSTSTTFYSLASFYVISSSTKCYSIALFSFDFLMNIGSIDVALGLVDSLACQLLLLLQKNSTCRCLISTYIVNYLLCKLHILVVRFFLLHIQKMMINATITLQPTIEYSTCLHVLFFSTLLILLFFSTISLPPVVFIYIHSYALPFPLLVSMVFQSHSLHSCCCEL